MQNIKLKKDKNQKRTSVDASLLALSVISLVLSDFVVIPLCVPKKSCSVLTSESRLSVCSLLFLAFSHPLLGNSLLPWKNYSPSHVFLHPSTPSHSPQLIVPCPPMGGPISPPLKGLICSCLSLF